MSHIQKGTSPMYSTTAFQFQPISVSFLCFSCKISHRTSLRREKLHAIKYSKTPMFELGNICGKSGRSKSGFVVHVKPQ